MKYAPRKTKEEKIRIAKLVTEEGLSIAEAARREGIDDGTLGAWLKDKRFNANEEYARLQEEKRAKALGKVKPEDPFPEGVIVAARTNPDELAKENKDLRKKVAYLEDKVAYMEALYAILKEDPAKISKKKDSRPSADSSSKDGRT